MISVSFKSILSLPKYCSSWQSVRLTSNSEMETKPPSIPFQGKEGQRNQDPDGFWSVRENLTRSIKEKLSKLSPTHSGYCIYRVPDRLRKVNEEAFTPRIVSIGPFHRPSPRLQAMEDYKLRWLQSFFKENKNIFAIIDFIVRNEAAIRQQYEDLGDISSEEFCEMTLLDSVFIIQLLQKKIFDKGLMSNDILHDMILIENQIPLFVPCTIYSRYIDGEKSFSTLVHEYFNQIGDAHPLPIESPLPPPTQQGDVVDVVIQSPPPRPTQQGVVQSPQYRPAHLTEYLRMSYFSKTVEQLLEESDPRYGFALRRRWNTSTKFEYTRSAKELLEAGVQFKRGEEGSFDQIEFKFKEGVLIIPPIKVNEWTENLFRNLIAFEQCKRFSTKNVSDYIIFMDSLINTSKDVDILVEKKIVDDLLNDAEEVSRLFNNLYKETMSEGRYFVHAIITKQLNEYSRDPWHQWKAKWYKWKLMLKTDYFSTPWSAISLIAATILLVLTVVQTICSVVSLWLASFFFLMVT